MLGALNDTPFVDENKIVINSFSWGNKNYEIKSSNPSHIFFLVTLDDNLLIKLTWPKPCNVNIKVCFFLILMKPR
jgi:hypothetical protein